MVVPQKTPRAKKELPIRTRFIDYFIAMPQIIRKYTQFADMARLGRFQVGAVKEAAMDMAKEFRTLRLVATTLKELNGLLIQKTQSIRSLTSSHSSKMKSLGQIKDIVYALLNSNEIPEYAALKPEDKEFLNRQLDNFSSANMIAARHQVQGFKSTMGNLVARAWLSHNPTMSWDKAKELGAALVEMNADTDRISQDPNADPELFKALGEANKKIFDYLGESTNNFNIYDRVRMPFVTDAEGKPLSAGVVPNIVANYRDLREKWRGKWLPPDKDTPQWHFEGRPGFTSEVRIGKFLLMWKKKGEEAQLIGIKTRKEYNKRYQKLADEFNTDSALPNDQRKYEYFKGVDKDTEADQLRGMHPEMFEHIIKRWLTLLIGSLLRLVVNIRGRKKSLVSCRMS